MSASDLTESTTRLGIDVGGTFTDIAVVTPDRTVRGKVRSTPDDPGRAVLAACELIAAEMDRDLADLLATVGRFGLGTTVVTNVLATRTGRRIGLLTTGGFEDLIPLARGDRVCVDGWLLPPPQLVERSCILGLHERTDREGVILVPVNVDEACAAARRLVAEREIEALVVSFLWSFRNPANEEAVEHALARGELGIPVLIGSALAPVIREYERTQFALLNAYVAGALDWLAPLEADLRMRGLLAPIVLMHSNGGATTIAGARGTPIGLAQSGPAAGAAAATELASSWSDFDVVTCDLGGTSLDVGLISGGEALRRVRGPIVGHWTALSMVDVDSVGSGGGSVAWTDAVGGIRVGPRSAGADPGPACYGRGGTEPTVTDALVVLGYIDPARFLDGQMPLDADLAVDACRTFGAPLGLDAIEAAWGIREVAIATMAQAVRARIASRGLSGRDILLLAYGGCGGLFAADLARAAGARRAVVPALAPVFSAHGAATASMRRERARSVAMALPGDTMSMQKVFRELTALVVNDLAEDGIAADHAVVGLEADLRFERQGAEITIPLVTVDGEAVVADMATRFRDEYVRRFGEGAVALGVTIELMTVRAVGTARSDDASSPSRSADARRPEGHRAATNTRLVRIERAGSHTVPVTALSDLVVGITVEGPRLVDAGDTTIWIAPGCDASLDAQGSLVMEVPR